MDAETTEKIIAITGYSIAALIFLSVFYLLLRLTNKVSFRYWYVLGAWILLMIAIFAAKKVLKRW